MIMIIGLLKGLSPISGRGSWPSSPQLSGGIAGLDFQNYHGDLDDLGDLDDKVIKKDSYHDYHHCLHDHELTFQMSRGHFVFEAAQQRRKILTPW